MDGNVVRPLLRKTMEWRKMGIVMASKIAMTRPRGDGFSSACTKSCMKAMILLLVVKIHRPEPLIYGSKLTVALEARLCFGESR